MDLGDSVLYGHGNVFLGNVRRRPGAAIAAIQVDNVCSRVIATHRHHVHVCGSRDLNGNQHPRIDLFDPVHVFLVILHRIDRVEGKGRKEGIPHNRLPHCCHLGSHLVTQQVSSQSGLGALGVFELYHGRIEDGFLPYAEQPGCHLGDYVIGIGNQFLRIAAFSGAGQSIQELCRPGPADHDRQGCGTIGHAPAIARNRDAFVKPPIVALVELNTGINFLVANIQVIFGIGQSKANLVEATTGVTEIVLQVNHR